MKRSFTGIFIFLFTLNCFAQNDQTETGKTKIVTRYGVKTGLTLAHFHITHPYEIENNDLYDNMPGFSGGYYMDAMGPSGHYSTQFGIQYSGLGAKIKGFDTEVRLHYIQVPLTFNARIGYKFINVFFGGGAYGGVAFMGKKKSIDFTTGKNTVDEDIIDFPGSAEENEDVKPFNFLDAGTIFGGGIEFVLPNDHAIQLGIHQYSSFVDISNSTDTIDGQNYFNPGIRNRCLVISLSYLVKK